MESDIAEGIVPEKLPELRERGFLADELERLDLGIAFDRDADCFDLARTGPYRHEDLGVVIATLQITELRHRGSGSER